MNILFWEHKSKDEQVKDVRAMLDDAFRGGRLQQRQVALATKAAPVAPVKPARSPRQPTRRDPEPTGLVAHLERRAQAATAAATALPREYTMEDLKRISPERGAPSQARRAPVVQRSGRRSTPPPSRPSAAPKVPKLVTKVERALQDARSGRLGLAPQAPDMLEATEPDSIIMRVKTGAGMPATLAERFAPRSFV